MTPSDLIPNRPTATRRVAASLCCAVLCACALPAFAQDAAPATAATPGATPIATVPSTLTTTTAASTPAARPAHAAAVAPASAEAMPMPERAMLLAGDINRLIGSHPAAPAAAEPAEGGRIQTVLKRALALLGTPYRWGGSSTDGFDCSGLVGYVFRTALGIELPRVSREMARSGEQVERARLSPGDLVFFGRRGRVDHVGIYVGDGQFVHAPRTGRDVTVSRLDSGYWSGKFLQARRIAGL